MEPTKLLRGRRVRLSAMTEADLESVARWYEDPDFLRFYDSLPAYPKTAESLKEWLKERQEASDEFWFAVRSVPSGDLIGMVAIDGIEWSNRSGWLSIGIGDQSNWNQGFGREATELLVEFAFNELNLHRITLTVFRYNERAIALYEKIGFQHEGTFRDFGERDGKRYDMLLYGLLRPEWAERKSLRPQE